jgi:hypothetical protein
MIFAGKWTPITVVLNMKGSFKNAEVIKIKETNGMWNTLYVTDIDGDGDEDILCGNEGENSYYKVGMRLYIYDFDGNGSQEQLLCQAIDGKYYPVHDIDEMTSQMPLLKKKYVYYRDLAKADIEEMFSKELVNKARMLDLEETRSLILMNDNGNFGKAVLPSKLQYSSIYAFHVVRNKQQNSWLIAGGNSYRVKPQFGRLDGSLGWKVELFQKDKNGLFGDPKPLHLEGQIRSIKKLNDNILVGINGQTIKICKTEG